MAVSPPTGRVEPLVGVHHPLRLDARRLGTVTDHLQPGLAGLQLAELVAPVADAVDALERPTPGAFDDILALVSLAPPGLDLGLALLLTDPGLFHRRGVRSGLGIPGFPRLTTLTTVSAGREEPHTRPLRGLVALLCPKRLEVGGQGPVGPSSA
jgi:hypothetical protein